MIFIIDGGGIVLPSNELVPWFEKLIASIEDINQIGIGVISKHILLIFQNLKN